jgi:hypothetical protein
VKNTNLKGLSEIVFELILMAPLRRSWVALLRRSLTSHTNPMKSAPIEKMKGGNIFLFSFAFLLRKKKAADETPIITHKPRNIGKMFSALFSMSSTGRR